MVLAGSYTHHYFPGLEIARLDLYLKPPFSHLWMNIDFVRSPAPSMSLEASRRLDLVVSFSMTTRQMVSFDCGHFRQTEAKPSRLRGYQRGLPSSSLACIRPIPRWSWCWLAVISELLQLGHQQRSFLLRCVPRGGHELQLVQERSCIWWRERSRFFQGESCEWKPSYCQLGVPTWRPARASSQYPKRCFVVYQSSCRCCNSWSKL